MKASAILEGLISIKKSVEAENFNEKLGICGLLCQETKTAYADVYIQKFFHEWSIYSGDIDFPVPSFCDLSAGEMYMQSLNMWVGEYGEARKCLLDFLIARVQQEVACETYQV